ncbi:MAG: ATP-grasp domain-containing protein, partial [Actinomycetota bacterium]|nr:ATP-grasp domain-containing protein [Actinomycetota bacterium]
ARRGHPGPVRPPVVPAAEPPTRPPTVVFVDEFAWTSFVHLAVLLRRRGVRAVRVTTRPPSRIGTRWCWDATVEVGSLDEIESAAGVLAGERVVDLHVAEPLVGGVGPALLAAVTPACRRRFLRRRELMDKLEVSRALTAAGLDVPSAVALPDTDLARVVGELGPRLVVKARVGAGGESVVMVDGLDELRAVVGALERPEEWYVERFVEGESFQVAGMSDGSRLCWHVGYRIVEAVRSLGPARRLAYLQGPVFDRIAQGVVEATGLEGLFNAGILRDADDRYWVHDVNPRVWGSVSVSAMAGGNVADVYAAWVAGDPLPDPVVPALGARADALPGAWDDVVSDGPRWSAPVRVARWWFPYWRVLGTGCLAYEASVRLRTALDRRALGRRDRRAAGR